MNWALYKDQNQKIWIGHKRGLSYFDQEEGILKLVTTYNGFDKLKNSEVFYFHENAKGVWLATTSGLYLLDKEMQVKDHFHKKGDTQHHIPNDVIAHIHEDKDGLFWLASKGGGIIQWNPKTKEHRQFTREEGLSNNVIYAIYEDDYDNLWFSSDRGIMSMNKEDFSIKNYRSKDGLSHEEFNTGSHYQATDGTIYFGTVNGLNSFHPKDFQEQEKTKASIQVTSFTKYNNRINKIVDLTDEPITRGRLAIFPEDRNIILKFALLDYTKPQKNIYAYKIEGLHTKWTYTDHPTLHLDAVPGGDYELVIKTQESNVKPLRLELIVHPPFYARPWFIISTLVILFLLIGIIIRIRVSVLRRQKTLLEIEVEQRTQKIRQQTIELKALDKLKSRFFANISHELRTPLTLILGPLSLLLKKKRDAKEEAQLETIQRNGKQLLQMVEEILDLSKLDANKLEINEKSTNLSFFAHRIFATFESQAKFQEINFKLDYQVDKELQILLDQDKTEKILNNFLSNALKFTAPKESIQVQVSNKNNKLFFVVEDSGKGIHPDDLPHIFERFYQSKKTTQAEGGTGIGLAFCKELAELMQGQLYVESALGKGSKFSFELELKEVKTALHSYSPPRISLESEVVESEVIPLITAELPKNSYTILLVEDNLDMQQYIKSLLQDDYKVIACSNGQIAWDYLQDTQNKLPQLIISDIMMPQMDGFMLLKHCKSNERIRPIPMILLTARSATKDKLNALTIGVDDYLTKPFLVEELLARTKNLLLYAQNRQSKEPKVNDLNLNKPIVSAPKQEDSPLSENDQQWIKELETIALESVDDADFDAEAFAKKIGMSRRNLQRRLKKVTGLTPGQYLREIRLQTARDLLERGIYQTVAEVAYASGFTAPYYFSKIYEKRFGKKITAYFQT